MFLSGFLCTKKIYDKKSIFWQKPSTNPFGKCRFFRLFLELHFSGLKSMHSFLSRISKNALFWLFFLTKKHGWLDTLKKIEKIIRESAFDKEKKKPGLKFNPRLAQTRVRTTGPWILTNVSFWLFLLIKKKHMRKRSIFLQKPWTNPFQKCRFFFHFVRTLLFRPKKHSFLLRISKNVSFWHFLVKKKKHIRKRSIF